MIAAATATALVAMAAAATSSAFKLIAFDKFYFCIDLNAPFCGSAPIKRTKTFDFDFVFDGGNDNDDDSVTLRAGSEHKKCRRTHTQFDE